MDVKDIQKLNNITHSIRSAQAVLQYGVGAMVDFPDQTLMTAAPEFWENRVLNIHDERLERALSVDYFGMPGTTEEHRYDWGIAYVRFPQWYFCPKCRRFQPIHSWYSEYKRKATEKQLGRDPYMKKPRCLECKQDLVPSRIVVACENGHIDDFPWISWVHDRSGKQICQSPILTFSTGSTASAGLEGLVIRCENCKARSTLAGAFDKDAFTKMAEKYGSAYNCSGNMPWKNQSVVCGKSPRAMQRGASSIYFPKIVSSLVIPPYSDKVNKLIEQSTEYKNCLYFISQFDDNEKTSIILSRLDKWAEKIGRDIFTNTETVKHILYRRLIENKKDAASYDVNSIGYRIEEYEALTGKISKKDLDGNDFVREPMSVEKYSIPHIKSISLIHKIREVRALTGFTRINPPSASESGENSPGFISVKETTTRWYPAYEVRGEGIFIEFDFNALKEWAGKTYDINKRTEIINENYASSYQGSFAKREITPQFVLLHTIAHLLIRQLSFECGYTAASLRERIYCNTDEDGKPMSGILIYTASGDSEGTLGGLVRQGYPDCLPRTFRKAIETGELCSNDPVCITCEGQGRDALNLAACHACALLPETSCEEFNVFLDRGLIVGTFENRSIGLYADWLDS